MFYYLFYCSAGQDWWSGRMGLTGCYTLSWGCHSWNNLICYGFIFISAFSYFCSHSPFRQHKTKDKHEIDRMTLTVVRILVTVVVTFLLFSKLPFPLKTGTYIAYFLRKLYLHMQEFFTNTIKEKLLTYMGRADHTTSIIKCLFLYFFFFIECGATRFIFSWTEVPFGRAPTTRC